MTALSSERLAGSDLAQAGRKLAFVSKLRDRTRIAVEPAAPRRDIISRPDVLARRVLIIGGAAMVAISLVAWMTGIAREPGLTECRVTPASLSFASHVNATIRMRGNTACTIPIVNRRADDFQVRIPPEHGVVVMDLDRVSYRPAPQFKGRDFFMVAIRDRTARFDGTSMARVHVFVK
jgi:hypothetical protein